jgi:autotransporter-associated beta strand protein
LGTDRSISTGVNAGGIPSLLTVTAGTVDLNGFSPAVGGLSDNAATTGLVLNNGPAASILTLGFSWSNTVFNASYSSVIADGSNTVAVTKVGTNTQVLAGINTYSGPTTISNGILVISSPGQIGQPANASTVTVAGGMLGGNGLIDAPVVVQSGGTLVPAAGGSSPVTLNLATNLTLGGTNRMNVNKDALSSDLIVLANGAVNYGGTLVVNNLSGTLALGDSFQLFNAPAYAGNFSRISGSPGTGLSWNFDAASGVLKVVSGPDPSPTNIGISISAGELTLSWPQDHTGWTLETQTNALNTGLGTNWIPVTGSTSTNQITLPVNLVNPAVFYRLMLMP